MAAIDDVDPANEREGGKKKENDPRQTNKHIKIDNRKEATTTKNDRIHSFTVVLFLLLSRVCERRRSMPCTFSRSTMRRRRRLF